MKMNESQKYTLKIGAIGLFIILCIGLSGIILEPVTDKLEASCEAYGMIYEYRDGQNCLGKDNILHPIYSKCPPPHKRGLCEIRFIDKQKPGGD